MTMKNCRFDNQDAKQGCTFAFGAHLNNLLDTHLYGGRGYVGTAKQPNQDQNDPSAARAFDLIFLATR